MKSILTPSVLTALTLVTAVTLLVPAAHAGNLMVNTDNDLNDGTDGVCSLREAMQAAFMSANHNECTHTGGTGAPHLVSFSGSFTITVGSTLPNVVNDVTVDGSGQSIIIDGDDANTPFVVPTDGALTLFNLTLRNGSGGSGGAVRVNNSNGSLAAINVTFQENSANSGGAIHSPGRLVLTNVIFDGNESTSASGQGGAISFSGAAAAMTLTGAIFMNNTAANKGGAIAVTSLGDPISVPPDPTDPNERFVMITGAVFLANSADGDDAQDGGGAIWAATSSDAYFSIAQSEFLQNSADDGGGGAILLTLGSRMAFVDPNTPTLGGIFASNFVGNSAGASGVDGIGGAILTRGRLTVVSSSFLDNSSDESSGGAIGHNGGSSNGELTVANVTFSGNEASESGGAIAQINSSGLAEVINSTFSDNSATNGSGGAIFNNNADDFEVANSILANSAAGGNCGGGAIADLGGNVQFPDDVCGTGIPVGDPLLDAPLINPGPNGLVLTMSLQQDSAALGVGDPAICTAGPIIDLDARGLPRPDGDPNCDSGAYESDLSSGEAMLVFLPTSHDFGAVQVGDSASTAVTLENTGDADATNLNLTDPAAPFSQTNNCPATLQPQEQCTVTVEFAPMTVDTFSGSVVASADGGASATVTLAGEGVAQPVANLVFTPSNHDFGAVQVGDSDSFGVMLENTGNADATSLSLSDPAAPFSQTNDCPSTLAPQSQCTVTVEFAPTAAGSFSDAIAASADGGVNATLAVSGEGVDQPTANLVFTPAIHDFGTVQVGDSQAFGVTLQNTGDADAESLILSDPAAPFSQTNDCPSTLAPQAQCTVTVEFAPIAVGTFSDSVQATADGGVNATLTLEGEGVAQPVANLVFTPASHDFGPVQVGDSQSFGVTLQNIGDADAENLSLSDPGPPFSQINDCPVTLPPMGSCTVTVEFAPVAVDTFSDSVQATADGGVNATLTLEGEGVAQPVANLVFTPASHDFGPVQVGDSQSFGVTLQNTGVADATNLGLTDPASPFSQTNDCPATLQPQAQCTVTIEFAPVVVGPFSDSVQATADGGVNATLTLGGEGVAQPVANLVFNPASHDFSPVQVGDSQSFGVTLQNTGTADAENLNLTDPSAPFSQTHDCPPTLPMAGTCTVTVVFAPTSVNTFSDIVEATADGGVSATLTLDGEGVPGPSGAPTPEALDVDGNPVASDGNGVFEPGELVEVAPAWRNNDTVALSVMGTASGFTGPAGASYGLVNDAADYGALDPGAVASCHDTGVCYALEVDDPASRPAPHWDATVDETLDDAGATTKTWTLHIGESFGDVPRTHLFYPFVEAMLHHGMAIDCGGGNFCPDLLESREMMAMAVLRAREGNAYMPTPCTDGAEEFTDVPFDSPFCPWIEELFHRGVVLGCGGGNYCPTAAVTRAQMPVFLLKTLEGQQYTPPPCTGVFADVACPSPFADWIEDLFGRGITAGCGTSPLRYCPGESITRGQCAVFQSKNFDLPLYGP